MEIPAQNVIDQKLALSKQAEETLEIIMLEQYYRLLHGLANVLPCSTNYIFKKMFDHLQMLCGCGTLWFIMSIVDLACEASSDASSVPIFNA